MRMSDRMVEAAEANVRAECDSAAARISAMLAEEGEDVCVDCDRAISAARKVALPSADRCIDCQELYEGGLRGSRYR